MDAIAYIQATVQNLFEILNSVWNMELHSRDIEWTIDKFKS